MWPGRVVVLHVLVEHLLQVPWSQNEQPVQALAAHRPHPALGHCVRSRCSDRGAHDPHGFGPEHRIEGGRELGIPVADEEGGPPLRFVEETPDVARDFMVAYVLGARLYNDGIAKQEPEAAAFVRDTILRRTSLRDPELLDRIEPVRTDPNGAMSRAGLAADYEWFREYGGLTETVDIDQLVDERYIQYAVSVLGPYR